MSNNNNKQTHTSFTTVNVGDVDLGIPEINQVTAASQNLVQSAEASTTTPALKPQEKNDSLGFLLDCAKRGQTRGKQPSPSICKVSRILRDHNKSSFEPQLVSIGPIHREDPKLKEYEWQKDCYLYDLLRRCSFRSTPKEILEACLLKVDAEIDQIGESYAGMENNYSDVELARMMVMDGCFILEFCFKHEHEFFYLPNKMQTTRIAMDLMLLENQFPFFVLQALLDCCMGKSSFSLIKVLDTYLAPYIQLFRPDLLPEKNSILSIVLDKYLALYIKLFRSPLPEEDPTTNVDSSTHDHVLGYLHKCCQLVVAKSSNTIHAEASNYERIGNIAFHSIVELDRSGMKFKPHQEDEWSMTIKFQSSPFSCLPWFWSTPTLLMPALVIDDSTELILRNFIAYEQLFSQDRDFFTSYAVAMDILINTEEDIAKLVESKVLVNRLGSNQEAADMINKICRNMIVTDFRYTREFKQMDKYYKSFWPKHIARLRRVYFSNPWSIIALLAAFILFGLTVTQTYYTIKGK